MPVERISKNISDVISAVKRQFGDQSGVQLIDSDIVRWVNDAQYEIVVTNPNLSPGVVTFNTIVSQATYPLLSNVPDMLVIHSLHLKGQLIRNTSFVEAQEFIIRSNDSSTSDSPSFWYEYAGTITLWPTPSAIVPITIFYSKVPTLITTNTAPLSLPDSYFKAIVDFCLTQAHEMDENFPAAQAKANQFDSAIQRQAFRTRSEDN